MIRDAWCDPSVRFKDRLTFVRKGEARDSDAKSVGCAYAANHDQHPNSRPAPPRCRDWRSSAQPSVRGAEDSFNWNLVRLSVFLNRIMDLVPSVTNLRMTCEYSYPVTFSKVS